MTKTTTVILTGAITVVAVGTIAFLLIRSRDPQKGANEHGKEIVLSQAANPADITTPMTTPASQLDNITAFPAWTAVPRGFQTFNNVPFQIDGMICLYGEGNASSGLVFPMECLGIPMGRKFETLYIYHATFYTAKPRTPVASVVFRYEDGTSATNDLLYSADVMDWYANGGPNVLAPTSPRSRIAWHGQYGGNGASQPLRFCMTAMENPNPSLEVTSIDLYSCKSRAAWCLMAMTPGKSGLMK